MKELKRTKHNKASIEEKSMYNISEEQIKELKDIIKEQEDDKKIEEKKEAFILAKKRYEELSLFEKLKTRLKGKSPKHIENDYNVTTIKQINKLYRGREEDESR